MNAHGSTDAGDDAPIEFPQANIAAVRVIADTLGSTLGPTPRDKLLVADKADDSDAAPGTRTAAGRVAVASDGAAILERLPVEHPIAPLLRRLIGPERPGDTGVEGEAMPDGTTTRAVLAGALLDEAAALLERGLHPQTVGAGYETARTVATETVHDGARTFESVPDPDAARLATARTAMTGNVAGGNRDAWAALVAEAVEIVGAPHEHSFDVRRTRGGSVADTRLVRGAVLDRHSRVSEAMPREVDDAGVLVVDGHDRGGLVDREPTGDVTLDVGSPADVTEFTAARDSHKAAVVDGFVDAGVDVVATRLGIDDEYSRLLTDAGLVGIRGASPLELTRLARATGARPVSDPSDVSAADVGRAGTVTELTVGADPNRRSKRQMMVFDDCPDPGTVTVLLHGVAGQVADQAATALRKGAFALGLAEGNGSGPAGVVPGGGAPHLRAAAAVRERARSVDERSQLAMDAYADALDHVVATLARNGGLDPLTVLPDARAQHEAGTESVGVVYPDGAVGDCLDAGILDPVATVADAYLYATDVAALILRIDDAIDAVATQEPTTDTDDVIYDEPAEMQAETLADRD